MKKRYLQTALLAFFLSVSAVFAADFGKMIVGTWSFDMGGNFMATVEYTSSGTLTQKMGDISISGTYRVEGKKLTTVVQGQTTVFTIVKAAQDSMTIKRDKDGKLIVYKRG